MARVTRSKKIEVAEDHTALASQTPLPDTPAKQAEPLVEIHGSRGMNTAQMTESAIASEVKGLKAAYKVAIGIGKKGKKNKSKKGNHITQSEETAGDIPTEGGDSPVPEATRLLLQSREGSLRSLLENTVLQSNLIQAAEHPPVIQEELVEQSLSAPRVTRRQLAQAQEGQCGLSDLFGMQDRSLVTQKLREIDFVSLFGGRSMGPSRSFKNLIYPQTGTNNYLYPASEAIANQKSNVQDTKHETVELTVQVEAATDSADSADEQPGTVNRIASSPSKSPIKTLAEVERVYGREDSAPPLMMQARIPLCSKLRHGPQQNQSPALRIQLRPLTSLKKHWML